MKKFKIIFWITTSILFLTQGVMTAIFINSPESKEGIKMLGYPEYFRVSLMVFKILGAITLIVPKIPRRIKEWAYAGFAFDFIFACISNTAVAGFGGHAIAPLVFIAILVLSYISYHKIKASA